MFTLHLKRAASQNIVVYLWNQVFWRERYYSRPGTGILWWGQEIKIANQRFWYSGEQTLKAIPTQSTESLQGGIRYNLEDVEEGSQ